MPLIVVIAVVLCDRFIHAREMVRQSTVYFNNMSSSIPQSSQNEWEAQITDAEGRRLDTPSVMDVIGAQAIDIQSGPVPISIAGDQAGTHWLTIALSIEEQQ